MKTKGKTVYGEVMTKFCFINLYTPQNQCFVNVKKVVTITIILVDTNIQILFSLLNKLMVSIYTRRGRKLVPGFLYFSKWLNPYPIPGNRTEVHRKRIEKIKIRGYNDVIIRVIPNNNYCEFKFWYVYNLGDEKKELGTFFVILILSLHNNNSMSLLSRFLEMREMVNFRVN